MNNKSAHSVITTNVSHKAGKTLCLTTYQGKIYPSSIGKNGVVGAIEKQEGDFRTPIGKHKVLYGFFRADRIEKPKCPVSLHPITPSMGWCDDPLSQNYNSLIEKPFAHRHEDLWREDNLYDIILVTDYNMDPVVAGKGSAIFIHLAEELPAHLAEGLPVCTSVTTILDSNSVITESAGCLKLRKTDLTEILENCTSDLVWEVQLTA